MAWVHDEGDTQIHEAWLTPFFDDGEKSIGSVNVDGVAHEIVEQAAASPDRTRPSAEIVGWLLQCECSRRGQRQTRHWTCDRAWTRVPSKSLENLAEQKLYASDEEASSPADRPDIDASVKAVWQAQHVTPVSIELEIRRASEARRASIADFDAQLDALVARARATGLSWERIGAAAGMKRASAHERWANRLAVES